MSNKRSYVVDWKLRLTKADKYFSEWLRKFKVDQCIKYFEGFQWEGFEALGNYTPYTVNLVYATVRQKRASLLFDNPKFILRPAPDSDAIDFDSESSAKRSNLKSVALNSWVANKKNYFLVETKMAAEDAFFGFGLVEVGYSANIIDNPNAQKPAYEGETDEVDTEPNELPDKERVFIKRIHFKQFRIGGRDGYIFEHSNWCGYFDYYDFRDVKEAWPKAYKDREIAGYRSVEGDSNILYNNLDTDDEDFKKLKDSGSLAKIWKLWDFRSMKICWYDETNDLYLDEEEFTDCHLHPLIFDRARTGFLPIPPVFNWLSPQNEINESSEQLRVHRRRASRHYVYDRSKFDEDEFQKLINGPDGSFSGVDGPVEQTLMQAVPLAPLDASVTAAFLQSKDNFNIVTATGSELRGGVDRETATAAAIKNQNLQQGEAEPKIIVAEWLCEIARSIIINLAKITTPFYAKHEVHPDEHLGGSVQAGATKFTKLSGENLEGNDFETDIEISSISPIDNQAELQKLLQFLSVINQFQEVAISPMLVRKIADKIGITDEQVIQEAQKMAQMRMVSMAQVADAAAQNGQGNSSGQPTSKSAQNINAQNTPPAQDQIRNQLQNQLLTQ